MKKFFLVAASIAIGSMAMAAKSDPSSSSGMAVTREGSTFKVYYKAPEQSDVKVTIYNASNQVVFSESFKRSEGFIRPYNFEKLAEGDYTIELKDENGRRTEKISYAEARPAEKIAKIVQLPGTEKFALLVPDNGSKSLSVDIYNEYGTTVYSRTQHISGDFTQLFNLEGLDSFKMVVMDSNGQTKTIYR
ncbi:MAG TPA: hypothetical protein VFW11_15460 [Cyclobacteriaceae bacterium]|nr:hypothetical protein [Cyclobacteriaceae bacterium]